MTAELHVISREALELGADAETYFDAPPRRRRTARMGVEVRVHPDVVCPPIEELHGARFWPAEEAGRGAWNMSVAGITSRVRRLAERAGLALRFAELVYDGRLDDGPRDLYIGVEMCPLALAEVPA